MNQQLSASRRIYDVTVSYTHLDVYKRQVPVLLCCPRRRGLTGLLKKGAKNRNFSKIHLSIRRETM